MKPLFYIVFSKGENFRFASRFGARAFAAACKLAGYSAIVKPILQRSYSMKKVQYQVVNANGNLIKFFGSDYASAKIFVKENESCGLMYGLHIVRYYVFSHSSKE